MSAQEYESLLAAAKLAAYTKSGFIMKPNEWGIFLSGHHFRLSECNIELDKKKFDNDAMTSEIDSKVIFMGHEIVKLL